MLERVITFSLDHPAVILALSGLIAALGLAAAADLPFDAYPDVTPVQVDINTIAPSLSPEEIEQQVSFPIEQAMSGLPGLVMVRSMSKFGLSKVTLIFEDGTDLYFARTLVMQRLQEVELPEGVGARPSLGPVATGLGEIYHYVVTSPGGDLTRAREIQDWVLAPAMRRVAGVAEVNSWGGLEKQYHVVVDPARLLMHDLTVQDLIEALRSNNANVGGGTMLTAGESALLHGVGIVTTIPEIEGIVIAAEDGRPIRVRDVAEVRVGHEVPMGSVTVEGAREAVLGLGFMLMGENSRTVAAALDARLQEARRLLPDDVEVHTVYNRTDLVATVLETVRRNLFEGALLVVAVLFLFLGHLRAAVIVALAIPLSMLFAFSLMLRVGVAGTLMSLGAIDFGLIVDSSVIMVENSVRRLAEDGGKRPVREVVREASLEVRRPTMFGELILLMVYLPILTLEGVEGKLFRPMALAVIFALAGSMVLSLTLMPVLARLLLSRRAEARETWLVRIAKRAYAPVLEFVLRHRRGTLIGAALILGVGAGLATRLGAVFVPRLEEGSIVINTIRLAGVSLEESTRYSMAIERALKEEFPDEIAAIWTRTGTPEVATDPMGLEVSDVFVTLRPRERWRRARTHEELVGLMDDVMSRFPGMRYVFTQPIEMRVNEMIAGIRADVGVKIFADEFAELEDAAARVEGLLSDMTGAEDIYREQLTGQPILQVRIDPSRLARFGIPAETVLDLVEAVGGKEVGEIREGQRRFPLSVKLPDRYRTDPDALRGLLIPAPDGGRIALESVATVEAVTGPALIWREWARRRATVQCNVRGRDVASFVAELRRRVERELPGLAVEYGGQFEHLERASRRLMWVVPAALALIGLLLYVTYGRVRDAARVFVGVPFAAVGGILALHLRDMPFSISAGVGFVALSGVSVLGDMVMVSFIRKLRDEGMPTTDAVVRAAMVRLRPVLMTALVAGLGFLPMALSEGVGAEVQRPLATVVIGGVVSSTILTLLVLPVLYAGFAHMGSSSGSERPIM